MICWNIFYSVGLKTCLSWKGSKTYSPWNFPERRKRSQEREIKSEKIRQISILMPGKGHDNPLQYSCLENFMVRGGWRAIVHGVVKSQTRLNEWTAYCRLPFFYITPRDYWCYRATGEWFLLLLSKVMMFQTRTCKQGWVMPTKKLLPGLSLDRTHLPNLQECYVTLFIITTLCGHSC